MKGQPPSAWQSDSDILQERERSMTPTRRIEVQPSGHTVHTGIDDAESDDGKRLSATEHPSTNSPMGMLKARKMRKIRPQLSSGLSGADGEPLYAQVDKKGKRKWQQHGGKDKVCDMVVMETDQPRLLRVREITSPERQQGEEGSCFKECRTATCRYSRSLNRCKDIGVGSV